MIINSEKSYLGKTQPQQLRVEPVEDRKYVQPLHSTLQTLNYLNLICIYKSL